MTRRQRHNRPSECCALLRRDESELHRRSFAKKAAPYLERVLPGLRRLRQGADVTSQLSQTAKMVVAQLSNIDPIEVIGTKVLILTSVA